MTVSLRARLGLAATAGLMLAAAFAAPAAAAADYGTVTGTYTNDAGEPIANVSVAVWDDEYNWLSDAATDEQGRYTATHVAAGPVRVGFSGTGVRQWAHRQLDYETAATFTLAGNATLTVDDRELPVGTVTGTVTEPDGRPVTDYWATLSRADTLVQIISSSPDENGRFSIEAPVGEYKLDIMRGATQQWWPGKTDVSEASVIVVRAGETVVTDDTLLAAGSLGGRITKANGTPMVDAEVYLYRPYDPDAEDVPVTQAWTDENGDWSLTGVVAGSWRVAFKPANGFDVQWMRGTTDPAQATAFTVVADERTVADDRAFTSGSLRGKLVDPAGAPVAGVTVRAQVASDEWDSGIETTTRSDGTWTLPGARPAGYLVSFIHPDSNRQQWAYGKSKREDAAPIVVGSGQSVTVDDTWLPGATLTVHAVDATTGAPVDGICAWVLGPDATACAETGDLVFGELSPGSFDVDLTAPQGSFYLSPGFRKVTLTAGETTTLTVPLALGGKVSASAVATATGSPLRRACVALVLPGNGGLGDGHGECTNTAGKVTTQALAPGTYQAFVFAPEGYGHQWLGATGGTGEQKLAAKIVVKPGKVAKAPEIHVDRAGTIGGTISDEAGAALPGANVSFSAWGFGAGGSNDVEADENGRYTIGGLGPYAWPLVFTTGSHPRQWSGNTANRNQAATVPVTAGATAEYDITLQTGVPLTGKVTVKPGIPAGQWRLFIANATTGDQLADFDSSVAEDGTYRVSVLGGQQVKIGWSVSDYDAGIDQSGYYENASDLATATKVAVPKRSGKQLDLTVGH
ncbi:carboxypeptidase-like regulatory domain-containing protein [Actinoplanes sp. NBRC 103695]|uniref:carboxypeptidase-like regulatory domain-containing protein n=1 Tax=Actinoplanes sp. NBRC 103695 TaxID=3032202 RepID=UPI0024A5E44B|nr:carboxypeptidase-like regulatory domain-containing protein [Actinoplanes sp. NBRC 103695]GLY97174.1 hypothetical protein Acsp02_44280 [Actinoplanes sp. NBRC 103695]